MSDDKTQFGPYQLDEPLVHRGPLSQISARHSELSREVWLTIAQGLSEPEQAALIARFAQLAQLPKHAGVMPLEIVREGERIGFAQEKPVGPSLAELGKALRAGGGLQERELLALSRGLGKSLSAWHRAGLVHGALAPEHIWISETGGLALGGGLSHALAERRELPEPGPEVRYRAPELIMGEPATTPTDVFALALIVFEVFNGKHPFIGEQGEGDLARNTRAVPTPGLQSPVRGLDRILERALEKLPNLRQPDAERLSADFEALRREDQGPPEPIIVELLVRLGLREGRVLPRPAPLPASRRFLVQMLAVFVVMLLVIVSLGGSGDPRTRAAPPTGTEHGRIRVLATPWAEVELDGQRIDITPLPAPLEVSPGRHEVVLRHPQAPDERRGVDVAAGQLVIVNVEMTLKVEIDAGNPEDP